MTDKYAVWKWLILVAALAFSMVVVFPPSEKIRRGIDLKGGTSITVEIDEAEIRRAVLEEQPDASASLVEERVKETLRGAQERTLEVIRNRVDNLGVSEPIIYPAKGNRVVVQLPGASLEQIKEAEESIRRAAFLQFRVVHKENAKLVTDLFAKRLAPEGYRIEGLTGGNYYVRDEQFPDAQRTDAFRERLGRFNVPDASYEFMLERNEVDGRTAYRPHYVKRRPELTGEYLEDASVDYGQMGESLVQLRFDSRGAKKFAQVTADYAPGGSRNPNPQEFRQLAIVLDDTLYSAPRLNEAIFGGRAQIEGRFTFQEAQFLANILRAGSLPAPVKIVEKRTVSPTLGTDSIRKGMRASIYGSAGVLVFMLGYYWLAGAVASVALIIMVLLLPLGMILTGGFMSVLVPDAGGGGGGVMMLPVLTLPGLAGIALTIAMSVDANVLIFERIREESGEGKRLWSSIEAGFHRAFLAIFDSNITTLLTGAVLFYFGSGPIRGFSVTLCAGIIVSMYTSLVVIKMLLGLVASSGKVKRLRMMQLLPLTSIDFLSKTKLVVVISVVLILGSWGFMIARGVHNPGAVFGVDFTGGAALSYSFKENVPIETVRAELEKAGVLGAMIQYQQPLEETGQPVLQINVGVESIQGRTPSEVVKGVMANQLAAGGFQLEQDDEVGAQVGDELSGRAIKAMIISLLGIVIYLWFRFELGFAVGATVATAHDVLFTIGLYALFGKQFNLPTIAALLTVVGYSVNDTIVVFDRIREQVRLVRNKSMREICNMSINQTLSRTLLTGVTTLFTIVMMLVFGGGALYDFALTLLIGIVVGTFSSIYVATPVALLFHRIHRPEFHKTKT
jgi:SecD/SecF fusion protein